MESDMRVVKYTMSLGRLTAISVMTGKVSAIGVE
jgi:hypothetical protein